MIQDAVKAIRRERRRVRVGVVLALAVGAALYFAIVPTRLVEAARVLTDIVAGAAPSSLKAVTSAPVRGTRSFQAGQRVYVVDVYRPGGGVRPRAALLLATGVSPTGKDDKRLVAFAKTLARARFLVVVPDIQNLRRMQVLPSDVDQIAETVAYIARNAEAFGVKRIGLTAVSYGVGPVILAATRPKIRDRVSFVVGIGGYYDMTASIRYFTTGYYRESGDSPGAKWRYRRPDSRLKWRFLYNNAGFVESPRSRHALRSLALARYNNEKAPVAPFMAALGPQARSIYDVFVNADPDKVESLLSRLPARMRLIAQTMDLSNKDLSRLRARLILIHGRDDRIVPPEESAKLAAAAPKQLSSVYLVDSLFHADLGPLDIRDRITLWWAMYRILSARDGS